jgi:hypothetical protein
MVLRIGSCSGEYQIYYFYGDLDLTCANKKLSSNIRNSLHNCQKRFGATARLLQMSVFVSLLFDVIGAW